MRRFALAAAVLAYGLVLSAVCPARADDTPSICLMVKWGDTASVGFTCSHGVTTAGVYLIGDTNPPTFTLVGSYPMAQVGSTAAWAANFAADWTSGPGKYIVIIYDEDHDAGSVMLDVRRASEYPAVNNDIRRVEQGLFTRLYDRDTNKPTKPETPAQRQRENLNRGFEKK